MIFTLTELVGFLGITVLELWINLMGLFVFSVIAVLKHESVLTTSWWNIFVPLFLSDALNAYFCIIVFFRMQKDLNFCLALLRLLSSTVCLIAMLMFKVFLCQKLSAEKDYTYSEVFAPMIVVLLQILVMTFKRASTTDPDVEQIPYW